MTIRNSTSIILALFVMANATPRSDASAASSIKQQIQAVYQQADAAASQGNAEGAVAHYSDSGMAQTTKANLSHLLSICNQPLFSTKIIAIQLSSNDKFSATVVIHQHFQALLKNTTNGRAALVTYEAKIREYWIKTGTSWYVLRSRTLSMQRYLNSQPVSHW